MPYIAKEVRDKLMSGQPPTKPGELNYLFTTLINSYLKDRELTYATINDVIGSLEGAKLEFYRRVAVPFENTKMIENGDVYDKR